MNLRRYALTKLKEMYQLVLNLLGVTRKKYTLL